MQKRQTGLLRVAVRAHDLVKSVVERALSQLREGCKYPWVDLQQLKDVPFIMQIPGQRTRETVDHLCRKSNFTPIVRLETSNIPAAVQLAGKGYGCFFVTETHLRHITQTDPVVCFSVGEPCTTVDFVAAKKNADHPHRTIRKI